MKRGFLGRVLRPLFERSTVEREMDAELRAHLEMEYEQNRARGLGTAEARRRALLAFGSVDAVKEECRDRRRVSPLFDLGGDFRRAWRSLRGSPGYVGAVVLTLALGLGANSAIFSVVHGVLIKPLPFPGAAELVRLVQAEPNSGQAEIGVSPTEMADYKARAASFEDLAEYHSMAFGLLGFGEPRRVQTGVVSAHFFDLLGVRVQEGRGFQTDDQGPAAEPVLLLSDRFWRRELGADADVIGRFVEMNDHKHRVVGVLPPGPAWPDDNDVWMPVSACPFRNREGVQTRRDARMLLVLGRLRPEVGHKAAQAELDAVAGSMVRDHPDTYPARRGLRARLVPLADELTADARTPLLVLLATASLVLLVACGNAANLMLARLLRRERELAVRAALGAGRLRLFRELLVEALMLSSVGGLAGLALGALGHQLLAGWVAGFTPRGAELGFDLALVGWAALLVLLTTLAMAAVPAFALAPDVAAALKQDGRNGSAAPGSVRARAGLVVAQLAFAFVVLVGAGLLLKSLARLEGVVPGFTSDNVVTARLSLDWTKYTDGPSRLAFHERLLMKLRELPGVTAVAVSQAVPLNQTFQFDGRFRVEGRDVAENAPLPRADIRVASPGYFQTLGVPLVRGRGLADTDRADAPQVALVNEALAQREWPGQDPLGRRFRFDAESAPWVEVVGVVGDVRQYRLADDATPAFYLPLAQQPLLDASIFVKAQQDAEALRQPLVAAVHGLDPTQPVAAVRTLDEVRRESLAPARVVATLLGLFAALALGVSAAGIGGLTAYSVSARTREMGVRLALGARPAQVLGLVLREHLRLAVIGLALGLCGALFASQALERLLFDVGRSDPLTYALVALLFLAVVLVACLLPARRVTGVDPLHALREA
ncbi:MAG: ABC transporter permease [Vicinamibacteria bacterium]|nr:ABC transporter permease [Vicinamibacteria bacterium]